MPLDTITDAIHNLSDRLNSREIIARIEEMRECIEAGEVPDAEQEAELAALVSVAEQGSANAEDWRYGVTLVRENHFVEYIRESFDDMAEPEERVLASRWPFDCIDWERAANEVMPDYGDVDFAGVTYWVK